MSEATVTPGAAKVRRYSSARWILGLLFVGNLLNFYDRQLPAIVLEQIKAEFRLDDAQAGLLASAFVIVGALAGVPLGRLADRFARTTVAGLGLLVWSLFTAMGGLFAGFWVFFASRIGVGIGEASYSPATGSLIADLYPSERRSRANAVFMLGFPLGLLLAFFTVGGIAEAFGSWRAPFLVAAVPGIVVAVLVMMIREPERGHSDAAAVAATAGPVASAETAASRRRGGMVGSVLRIRSMWGLMLAYAGYNFAAYAIGTFLTPVLQRYYGLALVPAAILSGVVIGVTGLIGLLIGGRLLDRAATRSAAARARISGITLAAAAVLSGIGLAAGQGALWQLVVFLGLGYLCGIVYLAASTPTISDIVPARQRSTAMGVAFAIALLLGGAGGPIVVGALSDSMNKSASSTLSATPLPPRDCNRPCWSRSRWRSPWPLWAYSSQVAR